MVREPDSRKTNTGKDVVSFSIAVNRNTKSADGKTEADFFRVQAWGHTANYVSTYLGKGRLVSIDGRLTVNKFTDKDGNNRESYEIVADSVDGLDRPKDEQKAQAKPSEDPNEYDPFA
jgi:single-strand DNA-binding protein